jgi:hypothetical protein
VVGAAEVTETTANAFRATWTAQGGIHHVRFRWNLIENAPAQNLLQDADIKGQTHNFVDGYLIAPAQDNWTFVSLIDSLRTIDDYEREIEAPSSITWKTALKNLLPKAKRVFTFSKGQPVAVVSKKPKA